MPESPGMWLFDEQSALVCECVHVMNVQSIWLYEPQVVTLVADKVHR